MNIARSPRTISARGNSLLQRDATKHAETPAFRPRRALRRGAGPGESSEGNDRALSEKLEETRRSSSSDLAERDHVRPPASEPLVRSPWRRAQNRDRWRQDIETATPRRGAHWWWWWWWRQRWRRRRRRWWYFVDFISCFVFALSLESVREREREMQFQCRSLPSPKSMKKRTLVPEPWRRLLACLELKPCNPIIAYMRRWTPEGASASRVYLHSYIISALDTPPGPPFALIWSTM